MDEPGGIDFIPTGPLLPVEGMSGPSVEVDLRAIYRTRTLLVRDCGDRTYVEVFGEDVPRIGDRIWCICEGDDDAPPGPRRVVGYVEEPVWPLRWRSSHSCRGCGHYIEGDWSLAPLGPEGDAMRERLNREMDRGCCDKCWTRIERESRIDDDDSARRGPYLGTARPEGRRAVLPEPDLPAGRQPVLLQPQDVDLHQGEPGSLNPYAEE